jgi:hypothetical protein
MISKIFIFAVASLVIGATCLVAKGSRPESDNGCIFIKHIGEEDKPLGEIYIFPSRRVKSDEEDQYCGKYWIERAVFIDLIEGIRKAKLFQKSEWDKKIPYGTFRVECCFNGGKYELYLTSENAEKLFENLSDIACKSKSKSLSFRFRNYYHRP